MLEIRRLIGSRIRELRKQLGFTQEDLGDKAEMDYRSIGSIERGERNLSLDSLINIANALGVTPSYLLQIPEEDKPVGERELIIQELIHLLKSKDIKDLKYVLNSLKMFLNYVDQSTKEESIY